MARAESLFNTPSINSYAGILNLHPYFKNYPGGPKYREFEGFPPPEFVNQADMWEYAWDLVGDRGHFFRPYDEPHGGGILPGYKLFDTEGFIYQLADLKLFKRLWKIYQLGLHREYPVINPQSRAEHSLMVTVGAVSCLQSMYDYNPLAVEQKLRLDFLRAGIMEEDLSTNDLLEKATKTLCLGTQFHDSGTVAGGDTIKYLLKSKNLPYAEEELIGQMLQPQPNGPFSGEPFETYRNQLSGVLERHQLGETELNFALQCIQGRSKSLIGELINCPSGDVLEPDRIAYTLQDWTSLGFFGIDNPNTPQRQLPSISDTLNKYTLVRGAHQIVDALMDPDLAAAYPHRNLFPWNVVDPTNEVQLSPSGRPIYASVDKILAIAYLRTLGVIHHYAGPKMLGLEKTLQDSLTDWINLHGLPEQLSLPSLLSTGNKDLFESLSRLPDNAAIKEFLDSLDGISQPLFDGEYTTDSERIQNAWASFPVKVSPGLDTLTIDPNSGETVTLKHFMQQNPQHILASELQQTLAEYSGKHLLVSPYVEEYNRYIIV